MVQPLPVLQDKLVCAVLTCEFDSAYLPGTQTVHLPRFVLCIQASLQVQLQFITTTTGVPSEPANAGSLGANWHTES